MRSKLAALATAAVRAAVADGALPQCASPAGDAVAWDKPSGLGLLWMLSAEGERAQLRALGPAAPVGLADGELGSCQGDTHHISQHPVQTTLWA